VGPGPPRRSPASCARRPGRPRSSIAGVLVRELRELQLGRDDELGRGDELALVGASSSRGGDLPPSLKIEFEIVHYTDLIRKGQRP